LEVPHRGDNGKTVPGLGHVEVGDENIEALRGNLFEGLGNGGRNAESLIPDCP
jgi:hypothetical protein